jgi:formylglycine-generating enzyme required for sulfatase activity
MKRFMLLSLLVVVIACAAQAQTGNRYALVIGNARYQNIESLSNPVNDATDIAASLRQLGYQVELKLNVGTADMARAISDYIRRLSSNSNNEGFFWYAGHGVQLDGENYLLPIDVETEDDTAVKYSSYPLNRLIESFDRSARNKVNVVVIDACRNNPFRNMAGSNRSVSRGLIVVEHVPQDLFIMYSTAPGDVAADGEPGKRNSPFTEAFLKHIASNEPFFAVVSKITLETLTLTGQKQRSFQVGSIISNPYYSLNPAGVTPQPSPTPQPTPQPIPGDMVRISGGVFTMGSLASEASRSSNEVPHQVMVSSFYIGKYEVTQKEWVDVMGTNPSYFKGDNLPVERVSWYDVIEYCNKRSIKEGLTPAYTIDKTRSDGNNSNGNDEVKWVVTWNRNASGYRLPTEAEWEYACRAGTTTPFFTGNNITTNHANYNGNNPYNNNAKGVYRGQTWAVGSGTPNPWGLYNMSGNVWEWCWDWYGSYASGTQTDPMGVSSGSYRVPRGGSWSYDGQNLRSASRFNYAASYRNNDLGFRLLRPSL